MWPRRAESARRAAPAAEPGLGRASAGLTAPGARPSSAAATFLDEVDVELGRGERVLVTGPSGSGKSTLAETIAGLLAPEQGEVRGHATLVPSTRTTTSCCRRWRSTSRWGEPRPRPPRTSCGHASARASSSASVRCSRAMPAGSRRSSARAAGSSQTASARSPARRALLPEPEVLVVDESLGPLDPATAQPALRVLDEHVHTLVVGDAGIGRPAGPACPPMLPPATPTSRSRAPSRWRPPPRSARRG